MEHKKIYYWHCFFILEKLFKYIHQLVTSDRWWTLCQNFRSIALMVWDLWCFEDLEENDDWLNEWITESVTYEGDCRTAPATPGLLKSCLCLDIFQIRGGGGGGFNPNPKVLEYFCSLIFGLSFGQYLGEGGGWTYSKSFGVNLR